MRVSGKIAGASIDFKTNKPTLTLEINETNDFKLLVDEFITKDKLSIEIKQYRERRSLDANAYAWVLMSKIAEDQCVTKEEVYRECIRNIGGNSEIVCVKNNAVDKLRQGWSKNGIGWITDTMPSKIEGCTNVILYYGSSTYDTKQMHLLLDAIIQECNVLGIPTETPDQIAERISLWESSR